MESEHYIVTRCFAIFSCIAITARLLGGKEKQPPIGGPSTFSRRFPGSGGPRDECGPAFVSYYSLVPVLLNMIPLYSIPYNALTAETLASLVSEVIVPQNTADEAVEIS